MCRIYSFTPKQNVVADFFRVSHNRTQQFEPQNAIFPNYTAPIVRRASDSEREIVLMNWGFVLPQPGKAPRRVTNVRDDRLRSSDFTKAIQLEPVSRDRATIYSNRGNSFFARGEFERALA
jgi:putative SOS response-associated peptidase YedK